MKTEGMDDVDRSNRSEISGQLERAKATAALTGGERREDGVVVLVPLRLAVR